MAKATPAADGDEPAPNIVVQLHSRHERSPDQYEVLLEGRRVAYVCLGGAEMPINFLPQQGEKRPLRLTTAEKIAIAERVRVAMAEIAAAEAAEADRLAQLIDGRL